MPKKIMEEFTLLEISAVDVPAQAGALAAIMKRAGVTPEQLTAAIEKRYIDPQDGAVSFDAALQNQLSDERYYAVCKETSPILSSLDTSLRSIVADQNLSSVDKQTMLRDSVENAMAAIRARWPDIEQALMKAIVEPVEKGDLDMDAKELQKKVDELTAKVAELTGQLEKAKDGQAVIELQKQLDAMKVQVTDLTDKLAKAEEAAKTEAEKAKMTDEEKEYADRLKDEDKKKKFLGMSKAERSAEIAKAKDGDETITVAGQSIKKSVVGEAAFAVFKAQAEETAAMQKRLDEETEKRLSAELTKRAETEIANLPGDVTKKVGVLKAIDKMDKETQDTLTTMLKAGDSAIKSAFESLGHRDGKGELSKKGKEAVDAFEKRVSEVAARDKLGKTEAMTKARQEFPKEFEAYQAAEAAPAAN